MVLVKLKRFSRSKEQIPEDIQPEPQPDLPTQIQTETTPKKQRGRPKKILKDDIPEPQQPQTQTQDIQQTKEPQQINNDFDTSMFSKEGSEILGRDKRIILTKIRQYKSLFPDTFKTFKIKANPSIQELQTYLDEMDSIVECDSVEQFLLDSILQSIKLMEGVSTYTKYDIQGLADLLKQNKQFHQLAKQLFIKYKVFSAVPAEFQLLMLVTTTAYICNCKNKRKGELNEYLNQPIISI